jgi:hypothetical protein
VRKTTNENNDMGNLFIVFTPFQLFVAQQIVKQEELNNNILIKGWVTGNKHFLEIYDVIKIDEYWNKELIFPDISQIDGFRTNSLRDIKDAYNNFQKLKRIVLDNNVTNVYLGEINNQSLRFIAVTLSHMGKSIYWFEEGSSHYVERAYIFDNSKQKDIKIKLRDLLYYLPLYHVKFARWRYNPGCPPKGLPMNGRFSIIPGFYNEKFDKILKVGNIISDRTKEYIEKNICIEDEKRSLFVSQPREGKLEKCCFEVIQEYFSTFDKTKTLYIKFHPREKQEAKNCIEQIMSSLGIKYKILSDEINIPIELFLQQYKFDEIILFDSSTYFYNGYIYPKTEIISLLPQLYTKCKTRRIGDLQLMRNYMNKMNIEIPQ